MKPLLCVTFNAECAHSIEQPIGVPTFHGHSYLIKVCVYSDAAFPVPLPQIQGWAQLVQHKLDHRNLNEVLDEAPTMEAMIKFVLRAWRGPELHSVVVSRPSLGVSAEWFARMP